MKILGIPAAIWRRLYLLNLVVITMILAIGYALPSAHAQNVTLSSARNCDANAVIFCGAGSVNQLINKFDNGDGRNSAASIHNIFSFFGVSAADVHSMNNSGVDVRAGNVTSSGQVFDGSGHLVATSAMTGGRQNIAGSMRESVGGTVFFVRPPSVSFASSPLPAFVVMQNGRFQFAVLASCGNVVKATPKTPPPKPTPPAAVPQPKPTPAKPTATTTTNVCSGTTTNSNTNIASQGGNCSTNTTVVQNQTAAPAPTPTPAPTPAPTPPSPSPTESPPTCDALTVTQGDNRTVTITNLQTTANGSTITGIDINWGDNTTDNNVANPVGLTHQFASDGTFDITAIVHFTPTSTNNSSASTTNPSMNQSATTNGSASTDQTSTSASVTANQAMSGANATANTPGGLSITSPNCTQIVSFTTPVAPSAPPAPATPSAIQTTAPVTTTPAPATSLVNTGPGSVAGIFAVTSVLGTLGHRVIFRRRI